MPKSKPKNISSTINESPFEESVRRQVDSKSNLRDSDFVENEVRYKKFSSHINQKNINENNIERETYELNKAIENIKKISKISPVRNLKGNIDGLADDGNLSKSFIEMENI